MNKKILITTCILASTILPTLASDYPNWYIDNIEREKANHYEVENLDRGKADRWELQNTNNKLNDTTNRVTTIEKNIKTVTQSATDLTDIKKSISNQSNINDNFTTDINYLKDTKADKNNITNLETDMGTSKAQVNKLTDQVSDQVNKLKTETTDRQQADLILSRDIQGQGQRITDIQTGLDRTNQRIDRLDDKVERGLATVTALTGLQPNPRAKGNTQIAIGTGIYHDNCAVAVGFFHFFKNNIMLNAGVAVGGSDDVAGKVGITFSF